MTNSSNAACKYGTSLATKASPVPNGYVEVRRIKTRCMCFQLGGRRPTTVSTSPASSRIRALRVGLWDGIHAFERKRGQNAGARPIRIVDQGSARRGLTSCPTVGSSPSRPHRTGGADGTGRFDVDYCRPTGKPGRGRQNHRQRYSGLPPELRRRCIHRQAAAGAPARGRTR